MIDTTSISEINNMKDREVTLAQFPKVTFQMISKATTIDIIPPRSLVIHTPNHKCCQIIQNGEGKAAQGKMSETQRTEEAIYK